MAKSSSSKPGASVSRLATPSRTSKRIQNLPRRDYTELDISLAETQPYRGDDDPELLRSSVDESSDEDPLFAEIAETTQSATGSDFEKEDEPATFECAKDLPEPKVLKREIGELMSEEFQSTIEISRSKHRWSDQQLSLYIDSLFQEFKFNPAFHFNKIPYKSLNGSTKYRRILLGGELQVKALALFMKGAIACYDSSNRPWYFCDALGIPLQREATSNQRRLILPAYMKDKLRKQSVECYEYDDIPNSVQERIRSYLLPNFTFKAPGTYQTGTTSTPAGVGLRVLCPDNLQNEIPEEPVAPEDWANLAQLIEKTYSISKTLRIDSNASHSAILACSVAILEIGRASSEGRTPRYRSLDILNARAATFNQKYIITKVFERLSSFLASTVPPLAADVVLLSHVETIAVVALVYNFMDVCDDQKLKDHMVLLQRSLKQVNAENQNSGDHIWAATWETIQAIEKTHHYTGTPTINVNGRSYPCKPCSEKNKNCDRKHPECGSCPKLGVKCEWLSFSEVNRRRTEEACRECKERHRACDRKRPTCDMCSTRKIDCRWLDDDAVVDMTTTRANSSTIVTENVSQPQNQIQGFSKTFSDPKRKRHSESPAAEAVYKKPRISQSSLPSLGSSKQAPELILGTCSVSENTMGLCSQVNKPEPSRPAHRASTPDSVIASDFSDDEPLIYRDRVPRTLLENGSALNNENHTGYTTEDDDRPVSIQETQISKTNISITQPISTYSTEVHLYSESSKQVDALVVVSLPDTQIEALDTQERTITSASYPVPQEVPPSIVTRSSDSISSDSVLESSTLKDSTPMPSAAGILGDSDVRPSVSDQAINTNIHSMSSSRTPIRASEDAITLPGVSTLRKDISSDQSTSPTEKLPLNPNNLSLSPNSLITLPTDRDTTMASRETSTPVGGMSDMMKALARKREKRAQEERVRKERENTEQKFL